MTNKQDVFMITAIGMYNKSEELADEAYKAYHRLIYQSTAYAESIWSLYLLHTRISTIIREEINQYSKTQKEVEDD